MDLRRRAVSKIMQREVVSLAPEETLDLTQDLMSLARVRHMPVLDGERLVGIVSQRDLFEASLSKTLDFDAGERRSFLESVRVDEVMAREVAMIGPTRRSPTPRARCWSARSGACRWRGPRRGSWAW